MLSDYFSLEVVTQPDLKQFTTFLQFEETVEGLMLCGVPKLLEGHCPWWPGLPLYLLKLATEVPLSFFVRLFLLLLLH